MHIQRIHAGSRSTSLRLFAGFLAACTCKPFVWDSKPGVTSYILLYGPVLKRADKSFREDVWSTEEDKQHTVQSLWDPDPKRRQDSGLSIISSDPGKLGGSWQRASSDSRGWKKVTIVHNAALKATWAMLPWQEICSDYYFSYSFPTNIYREGSEGWWSKLSTWVFLCLHVLPAPLSIPSLGWTSDLSRVYSGSLWQLTENEMKTWQQLKDWRRYCGIHSRSVTKSLNPWYGCRKIHTEVPVL